MSSVFTAEQLALVEVSVQEGARRACDELSDTFKSKAREAHILESKADHKDRMYWNGVYTALCKVVDTIGEAEGTLYD